MQLDQDQRAIVESPDTNIIIAAGAGSGKTRVITERVKYLLNNGVEPHNVIAITFTNMAAEEMNERLAEVPGIGDAFVGTIHSFANRVLKATGESYRIFNDELDNQIHRELIDKYCKIMTFDRFLQFKDMWAKERLGKIDRAELDCFLTPGERGELSLIDRPKKDIGGDKEYPESVDSVRIARNIKTFEDLLICATKYFEETNARVEHLLVDELQDIGLLEFSFLQSLNAEHNFFVGDDWQAIYGFKGGNVEIFKSLMKNTLYKAYYLGNNYRNRWEILDLSQMVIGQVNDRLDKPVKCLAAGTAEINMGSKYQIDKVIATLSNRDDLSNWFLLVRTNKDVAILSEKLDANRVPYVTFKRSEMSLADLKETMSSNAIKLLTIHSAKGLEADNVILWGNFPLKTKPFMRDKDERKVLYVGITRAREKLFILN